MADPLKALQVDHVGIAAPGPGTALSRLLGVPEVAGEEMPSGVAVGRFGPGNGLELVWEAREGSPVGGFLARRGPGLHHVALRVGAPIEALRERLATDGARLVGDGIERSSDGRKCFFVHPEATGGVLVEIVEAEPGVGSDG
ncbi:MAG: VOC family protein [Actinobacteria bacterium]|nr:VOC family protein [Actinomycetota bacterium]